mmetsp:Transcript_54206/g.62054  ORF Transcript_54206/g.62054 Transcript_54206/m.62054 type:complete len:286 (+) Transcript_54206:262-1119(+)|eukprot:CAMPEP_0115016734 /NCGR_PEP_ID=MMETSP0216-20121206/27645_1 /TAXON_ID=223996 /ORGANISM="Protocruzia adherens, Strain Boccale" /LENGTH=285 /DNA_ID=CAMNT_0002387311 /DNA_START=231 /DNA_END=1088 /DNA_ORIENTATION=-
MAITWPLIMIVRIVAHVVVPVMVLIVHIVRHVTKALVGVIGIVIVPVTAKAVVRLLVPVMEVVKRGIMLPVVRIVFFVIPPASLVMVPELNSVPVVDPRAVVLTGIEIILMIQLEAVKLRVTVMGIVSMDGIWLLVKTVRFVTPRVIVVKALIVLLAPVVTLHRLSRIFIVIITVLALELVRKQVQVTVIADPDTTQSLLRIASNVRVRVPLATVEVVVNVQVVTLVVTMPTGIVTHLATVMELVSRVVAVTVVVIRATIALPLKNVKNVTDLASLVQVLEPRIV